MTTKVYFNEPIYQTVGPPETVRQAHPTTLPYQEILQLARQLREAGWDERAIVVKRNFHPSGHPATYEMASPRNWGVVVDLRSTAVAVNGEPFLPLKVRWFGSDVTTGHWPDELILIHAALSQWTTEEHIRKELAENGD